NSQGTKITCVVGNCPEVEAANSTSVVEFENSLLTDVTGYVAIDTTNSAIVVAFRGTSSVRGVIADAMFGATETDICDGCTAATGFYNSWREARDGVMAAVKSASAQYPKYEIVTTGHSLGGAIADFAAAELRNQGYNVALYTYGSPRIGSSTISEYISNQPGGNYRVTHYNDVVPRLPPSFLNYAHISPEYYISSKNNKPVTANDIMVYSGIDEDDGNGKFLLTDVNAHMWYFNDISECNQKGLELFK
ncbi:hypothetical protein LTS18_006106, partial [Coniosporium uncinatum]